MGKVGGAFLLGVIASCSGAATPVDGAAGRGSGGAVSAGATGGSASSPSGSGGGSGGNVQAPGGTGGASGGAAVADTGGAKGGANSGGRGGKGGGGAGGDGGPTCDGFRLPADHPNAARDYDTSVTGVVTDAVTGLMWERSSHPGQLFGGLPTPNCPDTTLAGLSGWRYPTLIELETLVDFAVRNPAIDATTFPFTPLTWFATSSGVFTPGPIPGRVSSWTVDFSTGATLNGTPIDGSVRCVRVAAPPICYPAGARFQRTSVGGVDAVLDQSTTLTWQVATAPQPLNWARAGAYCESLAEGFRLPGIKELLSIVEQETNGVAIDLSAFPGTPAAAFWTSSAVAGPPAIASAWTIDFAAAVSSGTRTASVASANQIRCVR